jgi:hypothetical protein
MAWTVTGTMLAASKAATGLISFPAHAALILEERLREQEADASAARNSQR